MIDSAALEAQNPSCDSIVVMLRYNDFRELFMGDAGEASEARLLASVADLRADLGGRGGREVVKVGHHGSRYGSTSAFIAAVHPRIAIISVGRHNTFGHPAPMTIEAWRRFGVEILRTDQCGAIWYADRDSPTTIVRCFADGR
jgi:competence protein ComEC